ncbi:hypothetical protein HYR99_37060 [Candidatus Poribacteria bacterium]|nr:hypothetical protein [Candidatus Poribacteria bacterium]
MRQTIAQALIQEGREIGMIETKQEVLITLLQTKFGQLPRNIVERIQSMSEIDRLNLLLNRFMTANRLEEMGIE